MAPVGNAAAKQKFLKFIARKKHRMTSQRQAIISVVFSTHQHFTAEQLLEWSRRLDKSVSRATVYRTLPLLTASGLVREIDFGKDHKFYDPNYAEHPNHSHIICQDCEQIIEFESEEMSRLGAALGQKLGFSVKTQRLQITATCDEFRRLGYCTRKFE